VFLMGMVVGAGGALALGGFILQAAQSGALSGVPLLGALAPWRAGLVVLGLAGLPVALLTLSVAEPMRRHLAAGSGGQASLADAARAFFKLWRPLLPLYIAMGLANICDFAILNWAPTLLIRRFSVNVGEIGTVLGAVVIVGGVLGSFGAGLVADRMVIRGGPPARLRLAVMTTAVGVIGALLVAAPGPAAVFAMAGLWMLASTTGQSMGITVVQDVAPGEARGLAASLISLVNIGAGLALGAYLPPLILDHVLGDPTAVGAAVTIVALPCAIASTGLYAFALNRLRKAVG